MKAIVLYDSGYGNTRQVAEAIAGQLGAGARSVPVSDIKESDLQGLELFVAGSPIHGWRPTERLSGFLDRLQPEQLQGIPAAAFDTRMRSFLSGNAAKKIARRMAAAGAHLIAGPQAFYVSGREGPLEEGEMERAKQWAGELAVLAGKKAAEEVYS